MRFLTNRLVVSAWDPLLTGGDRPGLEDALAAMLTPAVLAPLPPAVQDLSAGVAGWIDRQADLAQGFTISAQGQIIGLLLQVRPEPGVIHVGYLFAQTAWGKGYASEMMQGLVAHLAPQEVLLKAGVATDNPASARVLTKAGFTRRVGAPQADIQHFSLQL